MRFFLSGPSGVGKSTIIKEILSRHADMVLSVSCTTRAPRPGEEDGQDYCFITKESFEHMIAQGSFLEWAKVHKDLYGTSLAWVAEREAQGLDVLFDIDVQGVAQAQEKGSAGVFIMLVPPGMDELERRLKGRGTENEHALAVRLENARTELRQWRLYEYLVVNDQLEKAIDDIDAIIRAAHLRQNEAIRRLSWLSETK